MSYIHYHSSCIRLLDEYSFALYMIDLTLLFSIALIEMLR